MADKSQAMKRDGIEAKTETAFDVFLKEHGSSLSLDEAEMVRLKWMFKQGYTRASIDALQGDNFFLNAELSLKSDPRPNDLAI